MSMHYPYPDDNDDEPPRCIVCRSTLDECDIDPAYSSAGEVVCKACGSERAQADDEDAKNTDDSTNTDDSVNNPP